LKITAQEVRYVADLANLRLGPDEVARMTNELEAILSYMDKLNELDTTGVPAMAQVLYEAGETATLREDVARQTLTNEDAVGNAPVAGAGFFKVPKVIER